MTGQIRVLKTQAIDTTCTGAVGTQVQSNLSGKPGDCITYVVTATNEGSVAVSNLTLKDVVPAYTTMNGTQPTQQCTSNGVTPMATIGNYSVVNNAVQCGNVSNTVPPNATMTLTFQVKINN